MTTFRALRRRIDRTLYRGFHALGRLAARPASPPRDPSALRRVLIVRHDRIGDWVVTTPLVAMLRELAPQAEVDVLASPANAALVRGDPRVSHVFVNDHSWRGWLRALRVLRERRYDLVVSPLYARSLREGLVAMLAAGRGGASLSVWRARRYRGMFGACVRTPRRVVHMTDRLRYVLETGLTGRAREPSDAASRWPMRLFSGAVADARADELLHAWRDRELVVVNLDASEAHRDWPPGIAADVIVRLTEAHPQLAFVLVPAPGREAQADEVRRLAGSAPVRIAPPGGLADLIAIVRRATIVVTPDSANVHIASALGRPVLVLTSAQSTDPAMWAPYGVPFRAVDAGRAPVAAIPAEAIVRAFDELRAACASDAQGAAPC